MKVQNNSIFIGNDIHAARQGEKTIKAEQGRNTIDGSAINANLDPIAAKKEAAKKKAMKIVGDAYANEQKLDAVQEARRDRVSSLKADMKEAKDKVREIENGRAELRELYKVDPNSQEEKDLKLLEKEIEANIPGSGVRLGKEEEKQIAELKANGLTEYQKRSLEMKELEVPYAATANEAEEEIKIENQIIKATKNERLKTHSIEDAERQAAAIMDAASDEIVGMLFDEAKEHIDDEAESKREAAKEKAEEKEALEARIEKAKEERKEKEEVAEDILEGVSEVSKNTYDMKAAQQEVKDMMSKMKLIEDDIKGAAVDTTL